MQPPINLDADALARLVRIGGPQFAHNMVDIFLDYAPTKLAEAVAAEREGDWQGVEDAMHPLRTCAGHVGAQAVRTLAVEIEDLARAGDAAAISPRLAALEEAMNEVKLRLIEKRAAIDAP